MTLGRQINTKAVEDYLKAIYMLVERGDAVSTSSIAERLNVTAASVTGMLKKLAQMNLIDYEPYKSVTLTDNGIRIALEVIRHHRLIELFLAQSLGMPWDQVHDEAERLEHVISEALEDRIDAALGHPAFDPHGAPIPNRDGGIVARDLLPLATLPVALGSVIAQVSDHDAALLRYLAELGLRPGSRVEVVDAAPFNGPLTVRVDGAERVIGREVAGHVHVLAPRVIEEG